MTATLAESVFLLSILKPIIFLILVGVWGGIISYLDKDLAFFYMPRFMWNAIQMAAGIVGFGLLLLVPVFWLGLPAALLILGGAIGGYIAYRNKQVPEDARWAFSLDSFTRKIDAIQALQARNRSTITLLDHEEGPVTPPSGDNPQTKAHRLLERVLDFALSRNADRIEIATDANNARMVVRIDGVLYPQDEIEAPIAIALMDYLKGHADMDLADRRRKLTGKMKVESSELGRHSLELLAYGSTRGLNLTMLIDTDQRMTLQFDELGLLDSQRSQLEKLCGEVGHVVLVSSPPEQGQTSTLYSLMQHHDPYIQSVNTLEDTIAFEVEGVNHRTIDPNADAEAIAKQVGTIVRSDPQVLLLSRFPDGKTAQIAAKGARDNIRVYVGMRNNDTFSTLREWYKLVGDPQLAADSLGAILAQRLVRKLCTTCRMPYKPDPKALKKVNLPASKVDMLYKASGQVVAGKKARTCPDCLGLGYRGRVGVFELMALDDHAREFIAAGKADQLRSYLRKQRMLWMQETALSKVIEGVTDIKEITRALTAPGAKKPRPAKSGSSAPKVKEKK